MGHLVQYRTASGEVRSDEVGTLESALDLIERLNNEGGATDVRLFREVALQVRTYVKVAVVDDDATPAATPQPLAAVSEPVVAPPVPTTPPPGSAVLTPPPVAETSDDEVGDDAVTAEGGKRSLFGRG